MLYQPSDEVLYKYAQIIINFAFHHGAGVKKGETVFVMLPETAKAFLPFLEQVIYEAGAHCLLYYTPDSAIRTYNITTTTFLKYAQEEQLSHIPQKVRKAMVEETDHRLRIEAPIDMGDDINLDVLSTVKTANKVIRDWMDKKEHRGDLTWNISLYPTPYLAENAGMTLQQYWEEVIKSCFLDEQDPVAKWKSIWSYNQTVVNYLNSLAIESLHFVGDDVDLTLGMVPGSKRVMAQGENMPSFEIFTSPDRRKTNGRYRANRDLFIYGKRLSGIYLKFEEGIVVAYDANEGKDVLANILKTDRADRLGEMSLTDKKTSNIDKYMATILYDENAGGRYGNMHVAIGTSFTKEVYEGPETPQTEEEWNALGFNTSAEHVDIISTADRTVTASLSDGTQKIIYQDGSFVL